MPQAKRIGTRALICGTKAATSCCPGDEACCDPMPPCDCLVDRAYTLTIPPLVVTFGDISTCDCDYPGEEIVLSYHDYAGTPPDPLPASIGSSIDCWYEGTASGSFECAECEGNVDYEITARLTVWCYGEGEGDCPCERLWLLNIEILWTAADFSPPGGGDPNLQTLAMSVMPVDDPPYETEIGQCLPSNYAPDGDWDMYAENFPGFGNPCEPGATIFTVELLGT